MAPSSATSWPSPALLKKVKDQVVSMTEIDCDKVRVTVSPYRICPLGAHIDHQGGSVTAMAISKGVLLGFIPSGDTKMQLLSGQFAGEVHFSLDMVPPRKCNNEVQESGDNHTAEECAWGNYARGAVLALQKTGHKLSQGIVGYLEGSKGFEGCGVSSSAAVGVAFLLALEHANGLNISQEENVELDRLIENGYLGLQNGVLDQSAILLSKRHCLTAIHCKGLLEGAVAKRAKHFFRENTRVFAGIEAWSAGNLEDFGRLMSESGWSSIHDYECGCEPLVQLREILLRAPGVYGARFSGAGFRGCCVALVASELADEASIYVQTLYQQAQPALAKQLDCATAVFVCDSADKAHIL